MFKRKETRRLAPAVTSVSKNRNGFSFKNFFLAKGKVDKYLLGVVLILLIFGLVVLFSASLVTAHSSTGDAYYYIKKQLFALFLGLGFLLVLIRVNYKVFKNFSLFFLLSIFVLLVLVFIPGIRGDFGTSRSWIYIFGFSIQPAEIAKLSLIFYLSAWVEIRKDDLKIFSKGLFPFMIVLSLIAILLLAQPDIGTLFLVFIISLSIYFVAGGNMKQIIISSLIFIIALTYFFYQAEKPNSSSFIKEYQLNRVKCLQDPDFDRDSCYQINQSLIAVGSGGLFGRGLGNSLQKFNYLPEVWSDSIFPIIAEEIGLVGSIILIFIYFFIFMKGMIIAKRAPDMYGRSLAVGISVWIFFQAFLNIGGMINLIPMTGVPLPFVSAGGTSLMMLLASCGILLNIGRQGTTEQDF